MRVARQARMTEAIATMPMRTWKALVSAEPEHQLVGFARSIVEPLERGWYVRCLGRGRRPFSRDPRDDDSFLGARERGLVEPARGELWVPTPFGLRVGAVVLPSEPRTAPRPARPGPALPPLGWEWGAPAPPIVCQLVRRSKGRVVEIASWTELNGVGLSRWSVTGSPANTPAAVVRSLLAEVARRTHL